MAGKSVATRERIPIVVRGVAAVREGVTILYRRSFVNCFALMFTTISICVIIDIVSSQRVTWMILHSKRSFGMC